MRVEWKPMPVFVSTTSRVPSQFSASFYDTITLLERECEMLDATHVIIQAGYREDQIRQDGQPYANARPAHPGVVVSLDSKYGPLRYSCDTFEGSRVWYNQTSRFTPGHEANLRAIALGLEALRKVDRYGVTKTGEQYVGFKQLPAGTGLTTYESAEKLLRTWARLDHDAALRVVVKAALRNAHPDHGGNDDAFHQVRQAQRMVAVRDG